MWVGGGAYEFSCDPVKGRSGEVGGGQFKPGGEWGCYGVGTGRAATKRQTHVQSWASPLPPAVSTRTKSGHTPMALPILDVIVLGPSPTLSSTHQLSDKHSTITCRVVAGLSIFLLIVGGGTG